MKSLSAVYLAAAGLILTAPAAFSYHLFYLQNGTSYVPTKWTTTANFTVGSSTGATDITAEVAGSAGQWKTIATASSPLGTFTAVAAGVKYNGTNFGTAWGILTGDGKEEVIFDEDGSAFAALGLDPSSVNGYGPSHATITGGAAVINDAFLLLNGTRTDFDRQSTETHELGHIQGLAHSAVGMYNSASVNGEYGAMSPGGDVLDPINVLNVPTMHPFSTNTGTSRRNPKPDDIAALSELYPTASFATTFGSISGTVVRCSDSSPLTGVSVRIVNTANPNIQLSRFTGYDGNTTGSYTINGIPPGTYRVLIEGIGANGFTLDRFTENVPIAAQNDFPSEYYQPVCGADIDGVPANRSAAPTSDATTVSSTAGGSAGGTNFKVGSVDLAFVIDNTGSMSEEISAVRTALAQFISNTQAALTAAHKPFPTVAIVPFVDTPSVQVISNNPTTLQAVVAAQYASGGGDCPEPSNSAVLTAGRLLKKGGVAMLFTDADSDYDGPSRATVDAYYRSKELRLSVILSGSCSGLEGFAVEHPAALFRSGGSRNTEYTPDAPLGPEPSVETFSDESLTSGGIFTVNTDIKSGISTGYTNMVANIADSTAFPAIGLVAPGSGYQGSTMIVTITGSNTNFTGASTVAFSGTGVTVNSTSTLSPTSLTANITIAAGATLSFRDVTVTTNLGSGSTEAATGIGSFQIVAAPGSPTLSGATPWTGGQGQTLNVQISGVNTHFASGTSTADFGSGITVNSLAVTNATAATANISIDPAAAIGFRSISVTTGAETAQDTGNGAFFVTAPAPLIAVLTGVTPNSGQQGAVGITLTITGQNTHFAAGTSVLSFSNAGIAVTGLTVNSTTSATATISITAMAPLGFSDVLMTTGGEGATLLSGFQVLVASTTPTVETGYPQTITFAPIPDHLETDPPFALTATASSSLPVTFAIYRGPATISGNMLTITDLGEVIVEAIQAGGNGFLPAIALQSFNVGLGTAKITSIVNQASMASGPLAPNSMASMVGTNLASGAQLGSAQKLDGAIVTIKDSTGATVTANLSLVTYTHIDFVVPAGVAIGAATVTVTNSAGSSASMPVTIAPVAPGLFTADSTGSGVLEGTVQVVAPGGTTTQLNPDVCFPGIACYPLPIPLSSSDQTYLVLTGTGLRGISGASAVTVTIGSTNCTVTAVAPDPVTAGMDDVTVLLPLSLAGSGTNNLVLTAGGNSANTVKVAFK